MHRTKLPNGLAILGDSLPNAEFASVFICSSMGRLQESKEATGGADILSKELVEHTLAWCIAGGGYAGANVLDDGSYHYLLLPPERILESIHHIASLFKNSLPSTTTFEHLQQRVYFEQLSRINFDDSTLPHFLYCRHFPGFPGHSLRERLESTASLSLDAYLNFREQALSAANLTLSFVVPDNVEEVMATAEQVFSELPEAVATNIPTKPTFVSKHLLKQDRTAVGVGVCFERLSLLEEIPLTLLNNMLDMRQGRLTHTYLHTGPTFTYWSVLSRPTEGKSLFSLKNIALEIDAILQLHSCQPMVLERAKNLSEKHFLEEYEGPLGRAFALSYFHRRSDEFIDSSRYLEMIRSCGEADIKKAVQSCYEAEPEVIAVASEEAEAKYLLNEFSRHRTLSDSKQAGSGQQFWDHVPTYDSVFDKVDEQKLSERPMHLVRAASMVSDNAEEMRFTIGDRLDVVIKVDDNTALDYFGLYVKGGRIFENRFNCGITQLLLSSILAGSGELPDHRREQAVHYSLNRGVEWLGGYIEADVTADISGLRGLVVSKNLNKILQVILNNFFDPRLPEELLIKWVKESLRVRGRARQQDLFHRTVDLYYKTVFGNHPYGLPRFGDDKSVMPLKRSDLYDWHQGWIDPKKALLTIVTSKDIQTVERFLSDLDFNYTEASGDAPAEILSLAQRAKNNAAIEVENCQDTCSAYVIGFPVPHIKDIDLMCRLDVIQHALSGPGSLLMNERSRDFINRVKSFYVPLCKGGVFFIYVEYKARTPDSIRNFVSGILDNVARYGLSKEEFARAHKFAVGSYQIAKQSVMHLIYELSRNHFLHGDTGVVYDYVRQLDRVTTGDVSATAKDFIDLSKLTAVSVRSAYEMG